MTLQHAEAVSGYTDGFERGHIVGWAWYPQRPHETVIVEIVLDGQVVAEGAACIPRPDLKTAGIGHGKHAFSIPFSVPPDGPASVHVAVRARGGALLPMGDLHITTTEEARATEKRRQSLAYLQSVFGPIAGGPAMPRQLVPRPAPTPVTFILYSATSGGSALAGKLGLPEYSYYFVMREFRAVLRRLGVVHVVQDPARQVDPIAAACLSRGEPCLFLSFAPPQNTVVGLRCPTIPVIAWEFPTIPDAIWDDNPNQDWRRLLCQTGRAITISAFAAQAIRAGMGADFPVAAIPAPVWDRLAPLRAAIGHALPALPANVKLQGFFWDSRTDPVSLDMRTPPLPSPGARSAPALPMRRGHLLDLAQHSAETAAKLKNELALHEAACISAAAEAEAEAAAAALAGKAIEEVDPPVTDIAEAAPEAPLAASALSRLAATLFGKKPQANPSEPGVAPISVPEPPGGSDTLVQAMPEQPDIAPRAPKPISNSQVASPPAPTPPPDVEALPIPDLAVFEPDPYPAAEMPQDGVRVSLDGIVFTAVLAPKDGRKNWQDILVAFAVALRDRPDATLVLKMIGADAAFWWWEFHDLIKTLPEFSCRVLVLQGFLEEADYRSLIAATHFVVNASLAEGMCLPLVEFMSARRPAISPRHTAMLDYITQQNALIVASEPEFCSWPHDPRNHLGTLRHRVNFPSLQAAFCRAYTIAATDSAKYGEMAEAAAASVQDYCADTVVASKLAGFLGLPDETLRRHGWQRRQAAAAEVLG